MFRIVLKLAILRQWKNRVSLLCQVLSLAAIMIPLLIIAGLKYGVIESLKNKLLSNPNTLAIHMTEITDVTQSRIATWRSWPETAFVTPCTGVLYSSIVVTKEGAKGDDFATFNLEPTAPGDPLMLKSGLPVPGEGEAVVTARLAKKLALKLGDTVILKAYRDARQESQSTPHRIVGVLPPEHEDSESVYAPLEYTLAVEEFILAGRGTPGSAGRVHGSPYTVILLRGAADNECADLAALLQKNSDIFKAGKTSRGSHPGVADGVWMAGHSTLGISGKEADYMISLARARSVNATPWVPPLELRVLSNGQESLMRVVCKLPLMGSAAECVAPPTVHVKKGYFTGDHVTLLIKSPDKDSSVVCRVLEDEAVPEGDLWVTPQLAGVLRYAAVECMQWDYRTGDMRFPVLKFLTARIYSNRLENTEPLLNRLRAEGVKCTAGLNVIKQTLRMERSLDLLFIIIATGAGAGAVVSFAMSLFNSAELHRKDYALIQLLGSGRGALALMPVADAVTATLLSLVVAFGSFWAAQGVIGLLFAASADEGLCRLEWWHYVIFSGACLVIALLASLMAAIKVLRISPAEIIRES